MLRTPLSEATATTLRELGLYAMSLDVVAGRSTPQKAIDHIWWEIEHGNRTAEWKKLATNGVMGDLKQAACSCSSRPRPEPVWYEHGGLERAVVFAPGYKCERSGGSSHGQHGMEVRWYLRGPLGVAQFVMYTDWPPSQPSSSPFLSSGRRMFPMAADLGWHATTPQYDGQEGMDCDLLCEGGTCFYDGSGLNAEPVMERFFVEGEPAIWAALAETYRYLSEGNDD